MKRHPFSTVFAVSLLLTFLAGCGGGGGSGGNSGSSVPQDMDELDISDNFDFGMTQAVAVTITALDSAESPVEGARFDIYDGDPTNGGNLVCTGISDAQGVYEKEITVAARVTRIYVKTNHPDLYYKVVSVRIVGGAAEYTYSTPGSQPAHS